MSATNKLDKIAARANAATEGPWLWIISEDRRWAEVIVSMPDAITVSRSADDDDADFIAHARTDVPALVAALREALEFAELWEASPVVGYNSAEQWEFDTLRDAGRDLRTAIERALS